MIAAWLRGVGDANRQRCVATAQNPAYRLIRHFSITYGPLWRKLCSFWLNQIELCFSKIARDGIARGVFTSGPDLPRKLMKYIRHYNTAPKTVQWRYFDPTRPIDYQFSRYGPLAHDFVNVTDIMLR